MHWAAACCLAELDRHSRLPTCWGLAWLRCGCQGVRLACCTPTVQALCEQLQDAVEQQRGELAEKDKSEQDQAQRLEATLTELHKTQVGRLGHGAAQCLAGRCAPVLPGRHRTAQWRSHNSSRHAFLRLQPLRRAPCPPPPNPTAPQAEVVQFKTKIAAMMAQMQSSVAGAAAIAGSDALPAAPSQAPSQQEKQQQKQEKRSKPQRKKKRASGGKAAKVPAAAVAALPAFDGEDAQQDQQQQEAAVAPEVPIASQHQQLQQVASGMLAPASRVPKRGWAEPEPQAWDDHGALLVSGGPARRAGPCCCCAAPAAPRLLLRRAPAAAHSPCSTPAAAPCPPGTPERRRARGAGGARAAPDALRRGPAPRPRCRQGRPRRPRACRRRPRARRARRQARALPGARPRLCRPPAAPRCWPRQPHGRAPGCGPAPRQQRHRTHSPPLHATAARLPQAMDMPAPAPRAPPAGAARKAKSRFSAMSQSMQASQLERGAPEVRGGAHACLAGLAPATGLPTDCTINVVRVLLAASACTLTPAARHRPNRRR